MFARHISLVLALTRFLRLLPFLLLFMYNCKLLRRLLQPHNRETGQKLGIATALMFTLPFIAFYVGMYVFRHKSEPENWAGALAIVVTNIVVGGYCYVAYIEDSDVDDDNDRSGPRSGSSKQRVD